MLNDRNSRVAATLQNAAGIKAVVKELQALNANIQQLQTRVMKLAGGRSDEASVKSKVRPSFARGTAPEAYVIALLNFCWFGRGASLRRHVCCRCARAWVKLQKIL